MNLATGFFGTSPSFLWRAVHAAVVLALVVLALECGAGILVMLWPAWLAVVATLWLAHRLHPGVRWTWFFMPGRRRFIALVAASALLAVWGGESMFYAIADGVGMAELFGGFVCIALATLGTWYIFRIFEGTTMTNIFKLVAPEREGALLEKLRALDARRAGGAGQAADFRGLDPAAVASALKAQVIGQDATVDSVVQTAFRRARLPRPQKPVATLLFVGPTSVGKTALAKGLANALYAGRMIRVDCAELTAEHSVQRLIGSPPGYTGSDQGGWLCQQIGRLGTGLILLDEIEKAHPVVMRTLMSLLDEARITEQSTSQVYNARGFLIVLTSNAAQTAIAEVARIETDAAQRSVKTRDALKATGFLAEVLARIDQVFAFDSLRAEDYAHIVERALASVGELAGVQIVEADSALLYDMVKKAMVQSDYGARNVEDAAKDAVADALADARDAGIKRVAIRVRNGQVVVEPIEQTGGVQ